MKALLYSLIFTTLLFFNKIDANNDLLREAVENPNRKEENRQRDVYRNPYETLNFFGLDRSKKLLNHLNEIAVVDFDHKDVVRHPLVSKIVKAYSDKSAE